MDAKFGQLKYESQGELFSAPGDAQKSTNKTSINTFEVNLMIQFSVQSQVYHDLHQRMYHL